MKAIHALLAVAAVLSVVVVVAKEQRCRAFGPTSCRPSHPVPPHLRAKLDSSSDAGEAIHLSLKMTQDEMITAREASRVFLPGMVNDNPFSYSGFLTVDPTYNSNMFYWFFEAQNGDKNAPVLLWLQGGPGGSSMFGLFAENGPYALSDDLQLVPRNITWNTNYAMLYIDNPVGVGFSYTEDQAGYSTDEPAVAQNLYTALTTFFTVYNDYADNDFYVTGESYAGKYIPAITFFIHMANIAHPKPYINLKGFAIGDGWTDPREQIQGFADMAFNMGLADQSQQAVFETMGQAVVANIDAGNWAAAAQGFMNMVDGPPDYFQNITGCSNYYDIRKTVEPSYGGDIDAYLNQSTIRQALHVGNHYYDMTSGYAGFLLTNDLCKMDSAELLPLLMNTYKCLFYNGQFDFVVGAPLTERYLLTIPWNGQQQFAQSPRAIWRIEPTDVEVAGWARNYGNVTQVVVRDAGHILPFDQPARAFDMITRFVEDLPFTD